MDLFHQIVFDSLHGDIPPLKLIFFAVSFSAGKKFHQYPANVYA